MVDCPTVASNHLPPPDGLELHRFPVDPWRLIEASYDSRDLARTETLFALGNGYLGMRANPEEGREAHGHGTYVNGFHETWRISHAENAFGFAEVGQTIVNVPDTKLLKLYVDDEPLILANADVDEYERVLDMRSGIVSRHLVWRTPGGKRVRVRSTRLISMSDRHLAAMTLEVTMLDDSAPVTVSSQILNRQDGGDEYHVRDAALGEGRDPRKADDGDFDPRKSSRFQGRVLQPSLRREEHDHLILGYTCTNSRMTMAVGIHHEVECEAEVGFDNSLDGDQAKAVIHAKLEPGEPLRITKYASYHTSTGVPCPELADRVTRTLDRARAEGIEHIAASSHRALDRFWESSDIEIDGDASAQQAIRWNLFQLAQATLATQEQGIAAKGVSGGGYDGHYFWDPEIYVLPFLAYTNQMAARKLIRFRWKLLDAARERAQQALEASVARYQTT